MLIPTFLVLVAGLAIASDISTFTDSACKDSFRDLNGPNGYPNGTCTALNVQGSYGSFQVVGLDSGCAVTIYGKDTTSDICSGAAIVATIAQCYNSSWVYYSIDECTTPTGSSSSLSSLASQSSTSTPSLASSSGTSSSSSPTSTSTSASSTSSPQKSTNVGAIVGGTVGGVIVLVALAVGFIIFMRKKKGAGIAEADATNAGWTHELPAHETKDAKELPADMGPSELADNRGGYKDVAAKNQEPVELAGHE